MTEETKNESNTDLNPDRQKKKSNLVFGGVVLLIVLGVGLFYAGNMINSKDVAEQVADIPKIDAETERVKLDSDKNGQDQETKNAAAQQQEIIPGNPVVARYKGKAITRQEVFDFAENFMGDVAEQLPKEKLFPIAVEQLVNQRVLLMEAKEAGIDEKPEVQEHINRLAENHLRTVFIKEKLDERLTDEKLKEIYDEQFEDFESGIEIKARHILVETEEKAKELISELEEGADFAALAKEHSTGPSGAKGGDLGYFTKGRMVPEFEEAAFSIEVGEYAKEPVKTQFGYHVILIEDKRDQQPPPFEEVKSQIRDQLARVEVQDILNSIREGANIEIYNINGTPEEEPKADKKADVEADTGSDNEKSIGAN